MRARVVPIALVLAMIAPGVALANDKEDCATAAEQAQRLRAEKKLRAARQQVILCARDVCPTVIRNDCSKWLRDVDAALPTVIIRVRDGNDKDLLAVRVTVDGQPFAGQLDGTAQPVDTGPHTFRYESEGMEPYEEQVLISQGEKDRVLKVQLKPKGGAASPKGPDGKLPDQPPPPPGSDKPSSGPGIAPWIIGGVGVAGLLAFGILETTGQLGYSSLRTGCGATPQKCTEDDVAPVRLQLQLAVAGLAIGVVGVGVAVTWLIVGSSSSKPAAAAASHFDFTPLPGGGYGGFRTTF